MLARSELSKPRMSDVMPTIDVMPMTTPSTVSPERSLFVRSVSSAMRRTSPNSPLFTSERLNGVERCYARGWVRAKEQADGSGDADPENDRPEFQRRRQRWQRGEDDRQREPEEDADEAAESRQRHRLGEHLRHDVAALRAERLPQADLTRPFGDDHQHDVHDDDTADQQRKGDDADEHGKDAVGGLGIESQDRV